MSLRLSGLWLPLPFLYKVDPSWSSVWQFCCTQALLLCSDWTEAESFASLDCFFLSIRFLLCLQYFKRFLYSLESNWHNFGFFSSVLSMSYAPLFLFLWDNLYSLPFCTTRMLLVLAFIIKSFKFQYRYDEILPLLGRLNSRRLPFVFVTRSIV